MPADPTVHIVLLSYNRCADTLAALDSLSRMTYSRVELVVVDNASSDGTVEAVREKFPAVVLLPQSTNLGFAAGANKGLQRALDRNADFVLVINNDVTVSPSMLGSLVGAMSPDVGAVAPLICYSNEPKRIWSAGFSSHPLLLEMRGGARGQLDHDQWSGSVEVDYLLGCAVLLSVPALRQVGLFDARYFFYYEDLDLSARIRQHGFRLLMLPSARMWHQVASSSTLGSPFRTYHLARSSVIFFRTHAHGGRRFLILVYRFGSSLANSLRFCWARRLDLLKAYWQGIWNGLQTP